MRTQILLGRGLLRTHKLILEYLFQYTKKNKTMLLGKNGQVVFCLGCSEITVGFEDFGSANWKYRLDARRPTGHRQSESFPPHSRSGFRRLVSIIPFTPLFIRERHQDGPPTREAEESLNSTFPRMT